MPWLAEVDAVAGTPAGTPCPFPHQRKDGTAAAVPGIRWLHGDGRRYLGCDAHRPTWAEGAKQQGPRRLNRGPRAEDFVRER